MNLLSENAVRTWPERPVDAGAALRRAIGLAQGKGCL